MAMTEPIDPPDTLDMHRALDRVSALAGTLADPDITLLRAGVHHMEDTIRGLMDVTTEQHEELLRHDLEHATRSVGPRPAPPVHSPEIKWGRTVGAAGPVGHSTGGSRE